MKDSGKDEASYVRRVQEDTRRYVQNLLSENEALRSLLAKLESEKNALDEQFQSLRKQLDRHRSEHAQLQRQLAEIEADKQQSVRDYTEIEQLNSNLANLYVTSYRLHGTVDRQEVLEIIQEIIINLVGSEEVAIFETGEDTSLSCSAASFDVDRRLHGNSHLGSVIGRVAETAETFVREQSDEGDLTACIAMKVNGKVTGTIAIFRLLPQKPGLETLDHELFDLLATHAATALYCARLHARLGAGNEGAP